MLAAGPARLLRLAPLLFALACLGAKCRGPLPGTQISMGHSFAMLQAPHIELQTGCAMVVDGYAGPGWSSAILLSQAPAYELVVPSFEGPVTVWLNVGLADQDTAGTAARVTELVERLLAIRDDLTVTLLPGIDAGTCQTTDAFYEMPDLGERFDVVTLERLDTTFEIYFDEHMDDDCHANPLGSSKRVAEAIRTSANLAEGRCW